MEAAMAQTMPFSTLIGSEKIGRRFGVFSVPVSRTSKDRRNLRVLVPIRGVSDRHRNAAFEVPCSYQNFPGSVVESETHHASSDEDLLLKKKAEEVKPYLSGRCVYLVGMMGSGKTTVGKILSQALGYSFNDCDKLIEQENDGMSVADIFKLRGEEFFRDMETQALQKLSAEHCHVISTGGGAVIRPINWEYMHEGVSVWLDVPLEALARRITGDGTDSRPLLPSETEDVYTETFMRLSSIFEVRGKAYNNARVTVSLKNIAAKLGLLDVCGITPNVIAIEALEQIANFLKEGRDAL